MKMLSNAGIVLSVLTQEWRELFERLEREGFTINWPKDGDDSMLIMHKQQPSVTLCLMRTTHWVATAAAYHRLHDLESWKAFESVDAVMISKVEQMLFQALNWARGGAAA